MVFTNTNTHKTRSTKLHSVQFLIQKAFTCKNRQKFEIKNAKHSTKLTKQQKQETHNPTYCTFHTIYKYQLPLKQKSLPELSERLILYIQIGFLLLNATAHSTSLSLLLILLHIVVFNFFLLCKFKFTKSVTKI